MTRARSPSLSRRALLGAALSSCGVLLGPERSAASEAARPPVLVCVFLRGAVDGLSVVVPYTNDEYYRVRPRIAVPVPGRRGGAIDLDGRFGLHPKLSPLKAAFDARELGLVHAVGSPHPTRSHFEAQDYMETAAVGLRTTHGWLARYLLARGSQHAVLRAVALSSRAPLALRGYPDAVITQDLRSFRRRGADELEPALSRGFDRLYRLDSPILAERAGGLALGTSALVRRALRAKPAPGVTYARRAQDFADVARLIKSDIGLEAAWIDMGGWDTHRQQGDANNGELATRLAELGGALASFRADLGSDLSRVVVVVMSEFGRTVRENGTAGTDHGHGSVMLVMGGEVKGGRVLGTFPSLHTSDLHEGRDLPVTTDFRDVLAEVCRAHLRLTDPAPLFPAYALDTSRQLGLFT